MERRLVEEDAYGNARSDEAPRRRHRGRRRLGKRRWDVLVQRVAETDAERPRQEVAQDRDAWRLPEGAFFARVTRVNSSTAMPHTRHLIRETDWN